jgi:hypothetical protein
MSLHSSSSAVTMRRPARSAADSSAERRFFTAIGLLVAVLVADALLIWAVAPSVADLATFYVSTT